jgi:Fas apoptotic inhibitory molecule (FAIM1)
MERTPPSWSVSDGLTVHSVTIEHAIVRGRIRVLVDGQQVAAHRSHWQVDTSGVEVPFRIGSLGCLVRVRSAGRPMEYDYQLFIDGRSADDGSPLSEVKQAQDQQPPPWLRAFLPSLPIIITVSGFLGIRRAENLPIPLALIGLVALGVLVAFFADRLATTIYAKQAWSRSRRNWMMLGAGIGLVALYGAGLIAMLAVLGSLSQPR